MASLAELAAGQVMVMRLGTRNRRSIARARTGYQQQQVLDNMRDDWLMGRYMSLLRRCVNSGLSGTWCCRIAINRHLHSLLAGEIAPQLRCIDHLRNPFDKPNAV